MLEYFKICRPEHWLKNIFILFGHVVAWALVLNFQWDASLVGVAVLSLIPACLIASANYILNEILDAPFDAVHPTKRLRGIPAGKVKVKYLWWLKVALIVVAFLLCWWWKFNWAYQAALGLLLFSGLVYNVPPLRLKDRAFMDVIAESFNNPIRLWLGYYALVSPQHVPPLSIVLAWWSFGALLMTGKRYSEFRFIGDVEVSGKYRKSFRVYTETSLILAMITYANLFCFCTGIAMAVYPVLNNLVLVFPIIIVAVIAYFRHAMKEETARLEPEQLLQNPWIIFWTVLTGAATIWLLLTDTNYARDWFHLMQPVTWG
ncbi:UbiA family prenyltransferase [Roseimicrobium sp. ORNL1]|uniref:UbiA family prenyltransferase n=1 Tax=Roseimicrobium sp. ORNL1 TaxID=2711231 RepID=UPI0013E1D7A6|nr:UbiA family prenyltransferase [Roseimicrobium sp. ORNL1]QIF05936.1 UbiA family prenyltransferase [Roseimicrobium sp. ORNL1]